MWSSQKEFCAERWVKRKLMDGDPENLLSVRSVFWRNVTLRTLTFFLLSRFSGHSRRRDARSFGGWVSQK